MKWSALTVLLGFAQLQLSHCEGDAVDCGLQALAKGRECAVGSAWRAGCKECSCVDPGYAECWSACNTTEGGEAEHKCEPDSRWQDECNKCFCTSNGVPSCTKMLCHGIIHTSVVFPTEDGLFPAEEKEKFQADDLKTEAVGTPIGKTAVEANKTTVCEAGKAFRKECNTCWCNDDGTSYFCTRKVCVPDLDSESTEPEELGVVERQCRPREVFELDCNTCRCDERGASFLCTRRLCVTDAPPDAVDYGKSYNTRSDPVIARLKRQTTNGDTPKPPVKTCEPGVKFRQDCNTCLCHTDGLAFSCTRYECNASPPPPPQPPATPATRRRREVKTETQMCNAGSVFEQGCNVCRCADDGEHVVCTNNKCTSPTTTNATVSEEPENAFRCTPGEQFKRACNDCTCSADGKSVFCTLKLCEKEVAPAL